MYEEFTQISLGMSNSEQLFLVKDDEEEGVEFNIQKRTALELIEKCQAASTSSFSSSHDVLDDEERQVLEAQSNVTEASEESEKKKKKICSGEFKAKDDHDDGFRTPTSLDHKIPVIKQCPPAPRKPKPLPSNKRKASPSGGSTSPRARMSPQLDFSQEVESLFPRPLLADLHRKVKKTRTEDR
ncbi:hypothetical protein PTKIN_Ptkin13bG0281800 [Pterospermum kingtungense]